MKEKTIADSKYDKCLNVLDMAEKVVNFNQRSFTTKAAVLMLECLDIHRNGRNICIVRMLDYLGCWQILRVFAEPAGRFQDPKLDFIVDVTDPVDMMLSCEVHDKNTVFVLPEKYLDRISVSRKLIGLSVLSPLRKQEQDSKNYLFGFIRFEAKSGYVEFLKFIGDQRDEAFKESLQRNKNTYLRYLFLHRSVRAAINKGSYDLVRKFFYIGLSYISKYSHLHIDMTSNYLPLAIELAKEFNQDWLNYQVISQEKVLCYHPWSRSFDCHSIQEKNYLFHDGLKPKHWEQPELFFKSLK